MFEILVQPVTGIIEGAFRFKPADSVFDLVFLDIPLVPIELNYPCHMRSIALPSCSVKHHIVNLRRFASFEIRADRRLRLWHNSLPPRIIPCV